ncbi:MAG: ABC transporter ATP-binding protein [Firmicutes bacterium]|nr:ABC transporter ATP-binding protein [Bacillota bacterium]
MSVVITIKNALKKFGDNVIIPDLSLTVKPGEFFTLLGPSGCGKTTLLRMIAGFNSIEGGEFYFDKRLINDLDPAKRNIGMVFQNYAIFPHLSVRKNVEFGLTNRKLAKADIRAQADKFLKLMQIDELADRMPANLSGGQQQRVALARALCIEPDVLLMDEPLSNLDAKLRVEMRSVIKNIQHTVGITTIYVTHDQEEAMAVSDRIAVMNKGVIQHIGSPKNIYQRPANIFVATFIGRSNVVEGELVMRNGVPHMKLHDYEVPMPNVKEEFRTPQRIMISIRPEELSVSRETGKGLRAVIEDSTFLGLNTHYFMRMQSGMQLESIHESTIESIITPGTEVSFTVNAEKINLFTADGSMNILEGVQNDAVPSTKTARSSGVAV